MIEKKGNPEKVLNYRPISLCKVSYKFISKILTNRLRMNLPKIISSLHSTFVAKRVIHNNMLIAHEVLSTFNRNGKAQAI